ncbi:MAG: DUF2459 domain-containing protein [Bacteroidota bacterium]|nr:DUF2459 domain-containing protein [Candidatus Kapabacteria bacterium]MDW8220460.1 DUF2459 domain-containing protein [Bacteroidota bacterium]
MKLYHSLFLCCAIVLSGTAIVLFVPRRWTSPNHHLDSTAAIPVLVTCYLYHSGLVMPVRTSVYDWSTIFPCLAGSRTVEVGWGDRDFYMSGSGTVTLALKALFASESSVLHVHGHSITSSEWSNTYPSSSYKTLYLSTSQYHNMVSWIRARVAIQSNGQATFLREGLLGSTSGFYATQAAQTGKYSIIHNCNVWNSHALDTADIQVPLWAGIPHTLLFMLPS